MANGFSSDDTDVNHSEHYTQNQEPQEDAFSYSNNEEPSKLPPSYEPESEQKQKPTSQQDPQNQWRFLASADLLIYYATEQATDYAFSFSSGDRNSSAIDLAGGNLLYPTIKWQPAFKLAVGVISPDRQPWDSVLQYFRFYSTARGSATSPSGGSLWARWVQTEVGDHALSSSVSASWKLKMDIADLEVGKNYQYHTVAFRPFAGFRGGYIGQEYQVNTDEVPSINRRSINSHTESNAWCFGFRGGGSTNIMLPYQFQYYMTSAGSLLASHYVVNRLESDSDLGERFSAKLPYTYVLPVLEMSMGFAWDSRTDLHQMGVRIALGYDFMVYWSQNVLRTSVVNGINGHVTGIGDLSLQGVDIKASFFF